MEKNQEVKDFTSAFNPNDILEDKKGKYFSIIRIPGKFDYLSLNKEEIVRCLKIALDLSMNN